METTLTIWNAHRASTIRRKDNSESPELTFNWRAKRISAGFFCDRFNHTATNQQGETVATIEDNSLGEWIVCSWKYAHNFEDLRDLAIQAFYATSHSPEERARQYIRDYESQLQNDLKSIDGVFHAEYVARYREWVGDLFSKHSRIMSPMITGPARFPGARNAKANSAYDSALSKFNEWRENYKKRTLKRFEALKTPEQRAESEWSCIKADIFSTAKTIYGIDTKSPQHRGYSRSLFVSNLAGRMETLAANGKVELLHRASEYIRSLNAQFKENGGKEIFTSRHKFWKLVEIAEAKAKAQEERSAKEDVEIEFDGGTVVKSFGENRLQIIFDAKPDRAMIDNLKRHGFRWSPTNGAWQRLLNDNSYYACADVINVNIDTLRKA